MIFLKKAFLVSLVALGLFSCNSNTESSPGISNKEKATGNHTVIPVEDLQWTALNPARGENSPRAANVWGDRKKDEATGFLVAFKDGFSSPPHIHNVTYKALVIHGEIHNDDPSAANMWMSPGSYWTQPKGESHITSAKGPNNMAYVEIEAGPYLVKPVEDAFDSGENPVNLDASNLVWVNSKENSFSLSFLWGKPNSDELSGTMIKLPKAFVGNLKTKGNLSKIIVVKGQLEYLNEMANDSIILNPGSFLGADEPSMFSLATPSESLVYLRTNGAFEVVSSTRE